MAKPLKTGLDYFPMDCVLDDKVALIEAEYDLTGFAIIIKLFQKIYGERGYYAEWSDEVALLFSRKLCVGGNVVKEIIKSALKRGIFDKGMYEKYSILTSHGIQKRYLASTLRRKSVELKKEYLLISDDKIPENVYIPSINADISLKNVDTYQQSKVKESKVKKSKVNNYVVSAAEAADTTEFFISLPLNDKSLYSVSMSDVSHYEELYPIVDVKQELRSMLGWCESNPQKRKTRSGIKGFITKWLNKCQNQGGVGYGANNIPANSQQISAEGQSSRDIFKGEKVF